MSSEYQGAMPRLYGAPAYTRPPRHRDAQRPFDPDDLPLEAHRRAELDLLADPALRPIMDDGDDLQPTSFLRRAILPFGLRNR